MARTLEVPLYQLFYDGEEPLNLPELGKFNTADGSGWGSSRKDSRLLSRLHGFLGRMDESNRKLLMCLAQKMATKRNGRSSGSA
jgi:hypothetical protein